MKEYHKIKTLFKRDPETNFRTLLEGQYAIPEFDYLKDAEWLFTEKVDGTNIRVMREADGPITFGGKTDKAQIPPFLEKRLEDTFSGTIWDMVFPPIGDCEQASTGGCQQVCLYGEGYGTRIQKGGGNYNSDGVDFVLFDVWIDGWWLRQTDVRKIASALGIEAVPILGWGTLLDMVIRVKGGIESSWGDFPAEGIVARPNVDLFTRSGARIITKLKAKDFPKESQ